MDVNANESWTYMDDLNEVTVSDFDPSEQDISLNNIFEIYKDGFNYKYMGEVDGLNIIELYPQNNSKNYYKIVFNIDLNNYLHSFSVFDNTNSKYVYTINEFVEEELDNTFFTFDVTLYPDIEVIDFR